MGKLDGKVAVITGAGSGIGRATARLFASEGAKVVVNDRGCSRDGVDDSHTLADDVCRDLRSAGGTATTSYEDVASREGCERLAQATLMEYGALDIWINNAGIVRDAPLLKLKPEDWSAVVAGNLESTLWGITVAGEHMRRHGGGAIVNTTSISGMLGNYGQANYAAASAGIYALTRTASIEFQRHDVRVNAVAPIAKTRMTEDLPMFEKIESLTAEHVAPVHLFLACDLSRELTGHVLSVAGGKLSAFRVVETIGQFKEGVGGVWTPEEISEHFNAINRLRAPSEHPAWATGSLRRE